MSKSRLLEPLPWYQWHPRQWQASRKVQRMGWAARGLYRELLDECWLKGRVPATVAKIADFFEVDQSEIEGLVPQFIRCFDVSADGQTMVSPFIEELRSAANERRIAQANRRRGKDKNGNPRVTTDNHGSKKLSADSISEPEITEPNQGEVVEERREEKIRKEKKEKQEKEKNIPPLTREGAVLDGEDLAPAQEGISDAGEGSELVKATTPRRRGKHQPRKESVDAFMSQDIPQGVIEAARRVYQAWPKSDPDGRHIAADFNLLVPRMADLVATHGPILTIELLEQAAMDYIAYPAKHRKAPQFFFGSKPPEGQDKPLWRSYAEAAYTRAKIQRTKANTEAVIPADGSESEPESNPAA